MEPLELSSDESRPPSAQEFDFMRLLNQCSSPSVSGYVSLSGEDSAPLPSPLPGASSASSGVWSQEPPTPLNSGNASPAVVLLDSDSEEEITTKRAPALDDEQCNTWRSDETLPINYDLDTHADILSDNTKKRKSSPLGNNKDDESLSDCDDEMRDLRMPDNGKKMVTLRRSVLKKNKNVGESRAEKEAEKARRKALREQLKNMRPGECMKLIKLLVPGSLLAKECGCQISSVLREAGVKVEASSVDYITWASREAQFFTTETNVSEESKGWIIILEMSEMEPLLRGRSLSSHLGAYKGTHTLTLLLYGSKNYFRSINNKTKNKWRQKVRGANQDNPQNQEKVTENDLEFNLTKLLFEHQVSCWRAETPADLAQILLQFTKSVAEAPHKRLRQESDGLANFYMRGDNRGCVKVDKEGRGLLRLWCQALTKFPLASLETAQAVSELYPSPALLMQALREDSDLVTQRLSEAGVRRAAGPLAATRRVGPELARKIVIFFTSQQHQQPLS